MVEGCTDWWSVMTDKLKTSTDICLLKESAIRSRLLLFVFNGGCPLVCDVNTHAKNSPGESHMGELWGHTAVNGVTWKTLETSVV